MPKHYYSIQDIDTLEVGMEIYCGLNGSSANRGNGVTDKINPDIAWFYAKIEYEEDESDRSERRTFLTRGDDMGRWWIRVLPNNSHLIQIKVCEWDE